MQKGRGKRAERVLADSVCCGGGLEVEVFKASQHLVFGVRRQTGGGVRWGKEGGERG